MKTTIFAVMFLLVCSTAFADWTKSTRGNTDYYDDGDGGSFSGRQIGNTYYLDSGDGGSMACRQIGDRTYCS